MSLAVLDAVITGSIYQWYKDGTPIAGATSSTLLLDSISVAQYGSYVCEVDTGNFSRTIIINHSVPVIIELPDNEKSIPSTLAVQQNYPNPFNPTTIISFSIPQRCHITLKVYNALGREVISLIDEQKEPGYYSVSFDASQLASGVYFYRLTSDTYSKTRKMILLK